MIFRIIYAIRMGWLHRPALKRYQQLSGLQIETVLQIDPKTLKSEGIEVLALDFDGVLASYGEETLDPKLSSWLNSCVAEFGHQKVFVLSNKPSLERIQLFSNHQIGFIHGKKKKPYPDGLEEILKKTGTSPHRLMLMDDRLLTGILAAEIAGVKAKWVTKPFIDIQKHPAPEIFFIVLRKIERWWLKP